MKVLISAFQLFSISAFLIGCARGPERTLHYRVPTFQYEQHDPQFSPITP